MAHHHERQVCGGCGAVIMQCRCMEPKVDRVVCDTCKKCNVATVHPYPGRPAPGAPVMTPVTDEDLKGLESFTRPYAGDVMTRVIAELRALRAVADAADKMLDAKWQRYNVPERIALVAALRDAGRLP